MNIDIGGERHTPHFRRRVAVIIAAVVVDVIIAVAVVAAIAIAVMKIIICRIERYIHRVMAVIIPALFLFARRDEKTNVHHRWYLLLGWRNFRTPW